MKNIPLVTISLINYNGKKFVFQAIESAVNQGYPNLEIILIDNASADGTREEIEKKIPEWVKRRKEIASKEISPVSFNQEESVKYIKNTENAGFGKPHNEAMRMMKGDFILLLNYDAILKPDYVKNALKIFENKQIGAVQGKLLRYDFDKNRLRKDKENPELDIIDTTGLRMFKNRRIVCIGQGEPDKGQFEKEKEIFGADGAVPIYRKKMLEDVKLRIMNYESQIAIHDYEYFDENFFMYKEDVDLAWRMRLAGWKAIYTPKAVAYHGRGSGDSTAKNYFDIIRERRKINNFAKYLSFKHQRLMQIKNDFPSLLFIKHFPRFIIKEIGAWIYMAIFERFTFRILKDLYRDLPLFFKKRKMVMAKKRVGVKEMEKWFE
ncbi:MAG: glycosyltransferase family 2 protein [Patescibacteria group bacterium]|nr:glycosyltransferase family 2 protein [Patescibacteria group bacterium]